MEKHGRVPRLICVFLTLKQTKCFTLPLFDRSQYLPRFRPIDAFVDSGKAEANAGLTTSRREFVTSGVSIMSLMVIAVHEASAFENKISDKYDDRPKRRGPKPKDLGVSLRKDIVGEEYLGLKNCGPAPNCFCSTDSLEDDPEHNVPAWIWPKEFGDDQEKAFKELETVINSYKPGQGNIDGGGFQIVKSDYKSGYIYAQFESLKAGYIDDFEAAVVDGLGEREVQIRSSSRVGYLDFGVNAKRLNYIAENLRKKGWDAPGVDFKLHQDYANQNGVQ